MSPPACRPTSREGSDGDLRSPGKRLSIWLWDSGTERGRWDSVSAQRRGIVVGVNPALMLNLARLALLLVSTGLMLGTAEAWLRWQINVSIDDFPVLLKQTTPQTLIDLLLGEEVGHHCIHL